MQSVPTQKQPPPTSSSYQNSIKLTQFGTETIYDLKSELSPNLPLMSPHNKKSQMPSSLSLNRILKPSYRLNTDQPNRKLQKAHELWARNRQIITRNVEKEMEKKDREKKLPYEWEKVSQMFRIHIDGILGTWKNQAQDQRDREKDRVKLIYSRKFHTDDSHREKYQTKENKKEWASFGGIK